MIFKINTQKTKLQKGFLVTEVLVTMFLIVITMVGILPLLFGGIKSSKVSKLRAVMTSTGQKEIESFNQKKFSDLSSKIKESLRNQCASDPRLNCPALKINEFESGVVPFSNGNDFLCIDTSKGTGVISSYSATCPKKIIIEKVYSYLPGQATITDDVIQYTVTVKITGETTKPVVLSAILGRDKI